MSNNKLHILDREVSLLITVLSKLEESKNAEIHSFVEALDLEFPLEGIDFHRARNIYEINLIKQALRCTNGNQTRAAKLLNMKLTTLNAIIKRLEIH